MASQSDTDSDFAKIFALIKQMELIAEDILADRQKLIELDRRRQKNREAQRALKQCTRTTTSINESQSGEAASRTWCVYGSSLVRIGTARAVDFIDKEQEDIEEEIKTVRRKIIHSTEKLAALEGRKGVQDFCLKPLTRVERDAIHKIIEPSA
ncbi:p53 and DNA damage-regulated protein 1-like [Varroa destructor]|uniref:P53 and DNA damage-regulated protein 1 n=1 Tax=Varroa destructor TaxID=109461 RepID=A0A7M7IXW9_VARDE|nr:p53 and DNA damage-regulated protein 1-like [Varroa destructor]